MEGQHRQFATTTRTTQVNGPMLVADPQLAGLDCVERRQYLYEDGTEFHERHRRKSVRSDNARCLESELVQRRRRRRNILLGAAPPLHHSERSRQRVHFRQLNIAIARDIALDPSIGDYKDYLKSSS